MIKKHGLLIGVIIILCGTYCFTLAPGLSWANGAADGGDLITAVAVNGVPHPTGYPLYLILGKLFLLLPVGSIAFRLNFMSMVFSTLAALVVFSTIKRLNGGTLVGQFGAALGALAFGLAPLIWAHAVVAEVYSLQSFLVSCIVYQTLFYNESPKENFLRGVIFGLALDNHITTVLLFPLFFLSREKNRLASITSIAKRSVGLIISLLLYIILPLHASNNPPVNWLNPVTVKSFQELISGSIYNSYLSMDYVLVNARASLGVLIENFGLPVFALVVYALLEGQIDRYAKRVITWVFSIFAIFTLFFTAYDSYIHLTNTVLASALLFGIGFNILTNTLSKQRQILNWVLVVSSFAFIFFRAGKAFNKVNAAQDDRAEVFANSVLNSAPEDAIVFTTGDEATFAMWYFHFAEGDRPDIRVISEGLLNLGWYQHTLKAIYPNLSVPDSSDLTIGQLISANKTHPYCFVDAEKPANNLCYINKDS